MYVCMYVGEGILTERGSSSALHKRSGHSVDGSVASGYDFFVSVVVA